MMQDIVIDGELFERLERISGGRLSIVRLPKPQNLTIDIVAETDITHGPQIDYEEWTMVHLQDGSHGWCKDSINCL